MAAILTLVLLLLAQEPLRLPCTADAQLSADSGEEKNNGGGRSALRLKGIEDCSILDFDVSPLRGRVVQEARLFIHPTGPHKLRSLGLSTIGSAWKEGRGQGEPARPGEVCFQEAAFGERPWAGPGSDFHAVSFGRGGSLWIGRELKAEADGWVSVDLAPALLHALVEGNSFGLALTDDNGQTRHNNSVYSREQSGKGPYLLVSRSSVGAAPPSGARRFVPPPAAKIVDRSAELLRPAPLPREGSPVAIAGGSRYRILHEGASNPDAAPAARIWNGREISLVAARGEHVGFGVAVEVPETRAFRLEGPGFSVSRVLPVGTTYDPLVPVPAQIGGKALFHVERHVPKNSVPGEQALTLLLRIGDVETVVPVKLRVHAATVPDALSFQVSLNAYGSPGDDLRDAPGMPAFLDLERAYYRLAHEHRATLAVVPYTQRGLLHWAVAPEIRRQGATVEIRSWETFDARWGPYFDGSAFRGLPRDGVPLAHLYWPHHENWPLPLNEFYGYRGASDEHWRDAAPPDQAFPEDYGKAFSSMVRAFAVHAASKGWTRTQFQVFLNNKPDIRFTRREPEGAWWRLDEPVSAEDHLAIRYFGRRTMELARELKTIDLTFRADLSRPQCRRDWLDGHLGLDVVAGGYRRYPELVFGRGEDVWVYGGVPLGSGGDAGRAWALQVFLDGGNGVVPWLALGDRSAWERPQDTALLMPPTPQTERRPHATLRLKGLRRGQLDIELLTLLLKKSQATRGELRDGLAKALGLSGSFRKLDERDAGQTDYGRLDPDRFEALRRAVLEALDR